MARWKPILSDPPACRVFAAVFFDDLQRYFEIKKGLESHFGQADYLTESIAGLPSSHAWRHARIVSFQRPAGREELVDLKRRGLQLQTDFQSEGRPQADIDIGYVTAYNVIRATTEDDFHRIYLYGGIYAEPLCYYEKLSFHPFRHTDDFYRLREVLLVLNDLRLILTEGKEP